MSILVVYGFKDIGVNFSEDLIKKYKSEFPLNGKGQRGIVFRKLESVIEEEAYMSADTFTKEDIEMHKNQDREVRNLMKRYSPEAVVFLYPSTGVEDKSVFNTENSWLTIVNSQVNDKFANLMKQRYHGKGFSVECNGHESHHRMPLTVLYAINKEIPLIANSVLLYGKDCKYPKDELNDRAIANQVNFFRGLEFMSISNRFRFL